MKLVVQILFIICVSTQSALACPAVSGLLDFNCDSKLKFVVTGDSIVEGTGDSENGNRGGYVYRLSQKIKSATFVNLGVYAITSGQLLRRFLDGTYTAKTRKSDVIIIDVGRNDCRDKIPPTAAFRNIKRLRNYFINNIGTETTSPYVIVAHQIPVRTWRRSCVEELNSVLLRRLRNKNFPAHLRFDLLPDSILSSDQIHPDSSGYKRITNFANKFINTELQTLLLEARPELLN